MLTVLSLKEVPVEVDLAIEADGYIPNYSQYQLNSFDISETSRVYEGHLVMGSFDGNTFNVTGIAAVKTETSKHITQKRLDEFTASEKGDDELAASEKDDYE